MSRLWRERFPWWVALASVILALAGLPFAVVKRGYSAKDSFCDKCGVQLFVESDKVVGSSGPLVELSTFKETELSRWFTSRFGTNCLHTWQRKNFSGQTYYSLGRVRLLKIVGFSGSGNSPSLLYLFPSDREKLESLFRQSPDACRQFIHARLLMLPEKDE